jgi:tetrahydromethanopterin S-methyltransferase subunit G
LLEDRTDFLDGRLDARNGIELSRRVGERLGVVVGIAFACGLHRLAQRAQVLGACVYFAGTPSVST